MSKFDTLPERALELAGNVGDRIRHAVPERTIQWVETGAALAALKTGSKAATRFVKRNPGVAVAAAVGAGLLWYVARRKAQHAHDGASEGRSKRIEARRSSGKPAGERKRVAARRPARTDAGTP